MCVFWFGDLNITHNEAISAFFILTCNTSIVILHRFNISLNRMFLNKKDIYGILFQYNEIEDEEE